MSDAINHVSSEQQYRKLSAVFNNTDEPLNYIQPIDVTRRALLTTIPSKDLLLINFHAANDRTGFRSRLWRDMCVSKGIANRTFYECISKTGGVQIKELAHIYTRNRQYLFWLSPRGRGLDCHRTWEALYLDIIPV
ncbi:unnamed protein product, partial [Adineta steineri]